MKKARMLIIVAATLSAILAAKSNGAVFQVTTAAGLQTALDTARTNDENDTIELLATTYTTSGSPFSYGTASNDNHSVTLSGGWNAKFTAQTDDPYETQLDGDDSNPVLQILADAANVDITFTIENLTILDGFTNSSDPCGAGIEAYTGTTGQGSIHLTIRNCLIKDNFAANNLLGGAIYSNCNLEVYDSRFLSNSASNGGAMYITYDSDEGQTASPIISNCYFEDNSNYGNQGSTIWHNVALQVRNCTFKGRSDGVSSSGPGSCIWGNPGSHLNITNSTFSGIRINYWGSAIQSFNGAMDITNCLFANNDCGLADGTSQGAVAYCHAYAGDVRTVNIANCTFVGNASSGDYGAVSNRGATMNLNNCIFWDNDDQTAIFNGCSGIGVCGTTTMRYCDYYDTIGYDMGYDVTDGGGNIRDDPMFISDEYHLGHWSPCIDAGNNNLVPADTQDLDNDGNVTEPTPLDLKGQARFYDDPCTDDTGFGTAPIVDIGAFEFQPAMFGTVNGKNVKLTLTDCDGNNVTFSLTGGGYGTIDETDCSFSEIVLHGTTEKSQFTISTKGKIETSVGDITVNGSLKAISAKTTNIWGGIYIDGSLATLTLKDADCYNKQLRIGASSNPKATVTMSFDEIYGLQINSDMPIKSITATEWTRSNSDIYAPWLGSLTIKGDKKRSINGDLDIYINLDGTAAPKGLTLGSINVAGQILGETWNITGNCGTIQMAASNQSFDMEIHDGNLSALKVIGNKTAGISAVMKGRINCNAIKSISTVDLDHASLILNQPPDSTGKKLALGTLTAKGQITNCQIKSNGNIGTVTAGKMVNTSCFEVVADACLVDVNAADGVLDLPPVLDDTFNQTATIKSIKIAGIKGQTNCFINSNIAAANISSAYVAYPEYHNAGVPFGISMWNNPTKTFTIKDANGTHSWKGNNIYQAIDMLLGNGGDMQIRRD